MYENIWVASSRRTNGSGRARLIGIIIVALVVILLAVGQARAAANSNPPTPYFVAPLNGSIVSGTVTVAVFAPKYSYWIAELGVDGGNWQLMSNEGDGTFALDWNTGYVSNGKHTLTARFTSELGGPPVAATSIRISVRNEEPDGQAGILSGPCSTLRLKLKPVPCSASEDWASVQPLPCMTFRPALKPVDCSPSDDWVRPLPCIDIVRPYGLEPSGCAPLAAT